MRPPFRIAFVLFWLLAGLVQAQDAQRLEQALEAMRANDWPTAEARAGRPGTLPRDIIEWHRLRAGFGTAAEVTDFLDRRPDWPGLAWLRRQNEPAFAGAGTETILRHFALVPPQTAEGVLIHARALAAEGLIGDAHAGLVLAWRTMPMGSTVQARYLDEYGEILRPHHGARLDAMLWDRHMDSARQMLPLVDDDDRLLAEARIALHDLAPGVDTRIAAVPAAVADAPGLAHDRFEWRMRKDRREDAIELILAQSDSAAGLGRPDAWAARRRVLARTEMWEGDPARAYRLAARHFLTPEAGYAYADLEWLAGYIALRQLGDPATALAHFERFDAAVATPISKGRGGYWRGRAAEAMGDADTAARAYADGALHQTSFYGLLSAEKLGRPLDPALASPPQPADWRQAAFVSSSVFQAGTLLLEAREDALAERFFTHLVEALDASEGDQLGAMAVELGHPHLAVMIAKRAAQSGIVLPNAYYPLHPVAEMRLPMADEMTLAIARRESEFDPRVVSGAGARGLMQVMPATAEKVAAQMGVLSGHSTGRLLSDWRYNAQLGARYLADLAADFDGNVIMMAAGYNAGPGRPARWMRENGDPRRGTVDIVDWIEFIPFGETRNYVMRVSESLPIYRARLGKEPLPIPFSEELTGSTLRAFAP